MKLLILVAFLITAQISQAKVLGSCDETLIDQEVDLDLTDKLIAYFSALAADHVLTNEDLTKLYQTLDNQNQLFNPLSKAVELSSASKTHSDTIDFYLTQENYIEKSKLKAWLAKFLAMGNEVQDARAQAKIATESLYLPIKFHRIDPKNSKTLNYAFEVMEIPITQYQWFSSGGVVSTFLGVNKQLFLKSLPDFVTINDRRFFIAADEPMHGVEWTMIVHFANAFSVLNGYPPAYEIKNQITYRKEKEIAQAQGYRIPTQEEFTYIEENIESINAKLNSKIKNITNGPKEWIDPLTYYKKDIFFTKNPTPILIKNKSQNPSYSNRHQFSSDNDLSFRLVRSLPK